MGDLFTSTEMNLRLVSKSKNNRSVTVMPGLSTELSKQINSFRAKALEKTLGLHDKSAVFPLEEAEESIS